MANIFLIVVGGIIVFTPADKIIQVFPKAKSPKVTKVVGLLAFLLGIVFLLTSFM